MLTVTPYSFLRLGFMNSVGPEGLVLVAALLLPTSKPSCPPAAAGADDVGVG